MAMLEAVAATNEKQFLKEAQSWETDKTIQLVKSRKRALWFGGMGWGLAVLAVAALAALTPLKRVDMKLLRVDNATGAVDVITEMATAKTTYPETVNKYFVQQYVRFREGYSRELAEEYYTAVGLMSAQAEGRRYFEYFNPKNPQSPLHVYGTTTRVRVAVKSVSFIKPNVALVRYMKTIEQPGGKNNVTHWAATVVFRYSGAKLSESDRSVNPLGFQVDEYRNDPDAAIGDPTPEPQQAARPAPAASVLIYPQ